MGNNRCCRVVTGRFDTQYVGRLFHQRLGKTKLLFIIKTNYKIGRNIAITILLLVILVVVGLFSSVIQTRLANQITQSLNETYDTGIRIGKTSININGSIVLRDVIARDHHQDTLFYIQKLATNSKGVRALANGEFEFETAKISGFKSKIIHYPDEQSDNLVQFIRKLQSQKKAAKNATLLKIQNLELQNGEVLWDAHNPTDNLPKRVHNLEVALHDFYLMGNVLEMEIQNLKLDTNLPLNVNRLSGHYWSSDCQIVLRDFRLQTPESQFTGYFEMDYPQGGWTDFASQVQLDLDLDTLTVANDVQALFLNENNPKNTLTGALRFKGSVNDFESTVKQLQWGDTQWSGSFAAKNILDNETASFEAEIASTTIGRSLSTYILAQNPRWAPQASWINDLAVWNIGGRLNYQKQSLNTQLTGQQANASFDLLLQTKGPLKKMENYKARLSIKNIDLAKYISENDQSQWSGQLELQGQGTDRYTANAKWSLQFDEIVYNNQKIESLSAEGNLSRGTLNTKTEVQSALISANLISTHSLSKSNSRHTFVCSIDKLDLSSLSTSGNLPLRLNTKIIGTLRGNSIPQMVGNLSFEESTLTHGSDTTIFKNFIARLDRKNAQRTVEILNSEIADGSIIGNYRLQALPSLLRATIDRAFPVFTTSKTRAEGSALVDLRIGSKVLKAIDPNIVSDEPILITGKLSDQEPNAYLKLETPIFRAPELTAENISVLIAPEVDQESVLEIGKLQIKDYSFNALRATSDLIEKKISLHLSATGGQDNQDVYDLYFEQEQQPKKQLFTILPSQIRFRNNTWQVNPLSQAAQGVELDLETGTFNINNISVTTDQYGLAFSGYYNQENDFEIALALDQVEIASILPQPNQFYFEGVATSRLQIKRSQLENIFILNGIIEDLKINGADQGRFKINSQGNTKINAYAIDFSLIKSEAQTLSGRGNLTFTAAQPRLDLNIDFQNFDLALLQPLGGSSITDFSGSLEGNANLFGPLNNLSHQGELSLKNAQLFIPYINKGLIFEPQQSVLLTDQNFTFRNALITTDGSAGTALLNGTISHNRFKDWAIDFKFNTAGIQILNKKETPDALFYGTGFFEGQIALTGSFKNPLLALYGKTNPGTSIKIPWIEAYNVSDASFVNFVAKSESDKAPSLREKEDANGLDMRFELEVTPEAEIEIVIDEVSKSYLKGNGSGNLLMEIDTKGKFNVWGDFIAQQGIYNFKNLGVIDKKFNVKPGGTIVWEGDPLGAQMQLEAVYQVPGGANPALLLDNPDFNRKIPTEVLIRLQGDLLKPENPLFEIDFPNTGGTVVTELQYRLNDPQRAQLQAISLLSQGIFINDVGVSVQGLANNLYEKASDVFSSLVGEENEKLKIGVNYLQGDKSSPVEIVSEDRLGLTLSTQLSDRILVNGKIGVPVGGVEETLIVGDVQIDFILNEAGSLRAKVFNKENEFRYFGDELGYTQGLGLSYQVDFNTFSDLIQKIIKKEQKKANYRATPKTTGLGLQFINKQ